MPQLVMALQCSIVNAATCARAASGHAAAAPPSSEMKSRRLIALQDCGTDSSARPYEQLWPPGEYDGDWARILDHLACGSEHPRHRIYSKCDNRVAKLVGRVEKTPCRVETNEAWDAALRGLPSNRGKQPVSLIGGVHSHAVVAAIGAIHKATVRRDRDFGRCAVAGEIRRQRGNDLNRRKRAALGIPRVGCGRAVEFIKDPHDRELWMKCQMAGAGPWARLN